MKKKIYFKIKERRYSLNKTKIKKNIFMLFIIAINIITPIWGIINIDKIVTIW